MGLGAEGVEPPCLGALLPLSFLPIHDVYLLREMLMEKYPK